MLTPYITVLNSPESATAGKLPEIGPLSNWAALRRKCAGITLLRLVVKSKNTCTPCNGKVPCPKRGLFGIRLRHIPSQEMENKPLNRAERRARRGANMAAMALGTIAMLATVPEPMPPPPEPEVESSEEDYVVTDDPAELLMAYDSLDQKTKLNGDEMRQLIDLHCQLTNLGWILCASKEIGKRPHMILYADDDHKFYECDLVMAFAEGDGTSSGWDATKANFKRFKAYVGKIYNSTAPIHRPSAKEIAKGVHEPYGIVKHVFNGAPSPLNTAPTLQQTLTAESASLAGDSTPFFTESTIYSATETSMLPQSKGGDVLWTELYFKYWRRQVDHQAEKAASSGAGPSNA